MSFFKRIKADDHVFHDSGAPTRSVPVNPLPARGDSWGNGNGAKLVETSGDLFKHN